MLTVDQSRTLMVERKNGNPAAEFAFEPSHVLATIRRRP